MTLRLVHRKRHNRIIDRNSSSFRNVIFPSYLEYQTMDTVQKFSDSEYVVHNTSVILLHKVSSKNIR
jgi:hypothetical protein